MSDPAPSPVPTSYLGLVLGGRFRIVERIGTGGMGSVWRAEQLGLGRDVAVKILKHELIKDAETVERFKREARATSLLVHPNTVRVFDFGETPDGSLFLAMELLEGELLTSRLKRDGGLGTEEAVRVIAQMLRSLAEAHSRGIVHRDLKPDNVFLARVSGHEEPVVKVLDFGIAKIVHGDRLLDPLETQAGTVFGTPRYMSPEQARGKPLDARSDLYSIGVVLYQLLGGRAPFDDDDAEVVMARHIRERPTALRRVAPEDRTLPERLERLVSKALEKDPRRRLPTAEAFENALMACIPEIREAEAAAAGGLAEGLRESRAFGRRARAVAISAAVAGAAVALVLSGVVGAGGPTEGASAVPWLGAMGSPPRSASAPADLVKTAIHSRPSGARVVDGAGRVLGATPLTLERTRGSEERLTLRLQGHGTSSQTLVMDGARKVVSLTPVQRSAPAPEVETPEGAATDAAQDQESRPRRRRLPDEPYEPFD